MGDGGGWSSPTGEFAVAVSMEDWELGDGTESLRLIRVSGFAVFPDFTEAASDLSGRSTLASIVEFRGLSVFPDPGILDRRDRNDRDDSFVSDLLKEG
jgi:hypothetical protein